MIKALLLIFESGPAWDRVVQAKRSLFFVLMVYLVPMILITTIVEGWALEHWGKLQGRIQEVKVFTANEVLAYETVQFLFLLVAILVCARFVQIVTQTFHGRQTFTQSFKAVAYGLSPMFLLKLLDIAPTMNPWVTWSLGIVLSVWILYQGLPRIMTPDPTHAFGVYLVTALVLILATGMVRTLTA